jgi:hypothetical protein
LYGLVPKPNAKILDPKASIDNFAFLLYQKILFFVKTDPMRGKHFGNDENTFSLTPDP